MYVFSVLPETSVWKQVTNAVDLLKWMLRLEVGLVVGISHVLSAVGIH